MLNSVLKDAIKKRDETLSILKGPTFEKIIRQAKSNWIDFSPTKQDVTAAGIDSSFNNTKFQGAELWAVVQAGGPERPPSLCHLFWTPDHRRSDGRQDGAIDQRMGGWLCGYGAVIRSKRGPTQ